MCGIVGVAFANGSSGAEPFVRAMLPALARRGPDAEGLHLWPGVGFGHRRLAILDLSPAGAQPMLSADGKVGVVFNGCIYNFVEIRCELKKRGHAFRSQCDTEVLIKGYREWGAEGLLPRLRGMFAFAIWDETRRTLTLARDRLGVKPLVYRLLDGGLVFASTLEALHAAGYATEVDPQSALEFLDLGFVTDERSIFKGTRKLPGEVAAGPERLQLPASANIAIYVGRLSKEKGLEPLIRGFAQAVKQGAMSAPESFLLLVGDGPMRAEPESLAGTLGLGPAEITGRVPLSEVPFWLRASEVFALTSPNEGFPWALLEAMCADLPSVVSDIPANRQLVADGIHGLTVPWSDEIAIGQALLRLFREPELRKRMGRDARECIAGNYSTERVAKRYEALFGAVSEHGRGLKVLAGSLNPLSASNKFGTTTLKPPWLFPRSGVQRVRLPDASRRGTFAEASARRKW